MKLYLSAWSILDKKNQRKFFFIIFLFLILSFLEIIGIASVIPFVTAIFSPEKLSNLPILSNFTDTIQENKNIILPICCIIFFSIFLIKNVFSIIIINVLEIRIFIPVKKYVIGIRIEIKPKL